MPYGHHAEPAYGHHAEPSYGGHHAEPSYGGHHVGKRDADPKRRKDGASGGKGSGKKRNADYGYGPPPPQPKITYKTYQQCDEVEQETCFNIPVIKNEEVEVKMGYPKANR